MKHYSYNNDCIEFSILTERNELYLIGTFSDWGKKEEYKLEKKGQFFYLKKEIKEVEKLGNSGYPEYYIWDDREKEIVPFEKNYPKGYYFNNQANGDYNYLILPQSITEGELEKIEEDSKKSFRIKAFLDEFDTAQELGNFREVNGGKLKKGRLFRSYHPLIPSREDNYKLRDIEVYRQRAVRELIDLKEINCVINLSESKKELDRFIEKDKMSYYKKLWFIGSVHNIPMSYETVYFMSDKDISFNKGEYGFERGIAEIIKTIAFNTGPYHIHCRLGSDRTGVVVAFLQLLMGASMKEVEANYTLTNDLGIGEYRSFRLLEYTLKNALGKDCFEDSSNKVKSYLLEHGVHKDIIRKAYENLS